MVAINSNDTDIKPDDSLEEMKKRAIEKEYTFPYLKDTEKVYKMYGATKNPHMYVLTKSGNDLKVEYIGAIDDNYQDSDEVEEAYLANALDAILAGNKPNPSFTKAVGCSIKAKN